MGCTANFPFTLYVYTPPTVANAIPDQVVIVPNAFNYTVPANTFADAQGAALCYAATLADGSPMPPGFSFDPSSSTFSGTPDITHWRPVDHRHRDRSGQPAGIRPLHPHRISPDTGHRPGAGLAGHLL